MRDLAKVGQMFVRDGKGLLRTHRIAMLMNARFPNSDFFNTYIKPDEGDREGGFYCDYGLAIHSLDTLDDGCHDDPFPQRLSYNGHSGEAYGLRSGLWFGQSEGIAFFTTAVPDDAPKGKSAFTAAEEAVIARAYLPKP